MERQDEGSREEKVRAVRSSSLISSKKQGREGGRGGLSLIKNKTKTKEGYQDTGKKESKSNGRGDLVSFLERADHLDALLPPIDDRLAFLHEVVEDVGPIQL